MGLINNGSGFFSTRLTHTPQKGFATAKVIPILAPAFGCVGTKDFAIGCFNGQNGRFGVASVLQKGMHGGTIAHQRVPQPKVFARFGKREELLQTFHEWRRQNMRLGTLVFTIGTNNLKWQSTTTTIAIFVLVLEHHPWVVIIHFIFFIVHLPRITFTGVLVSHGGTDISQKVNVSHKQSRRRLVRKTALNGSSKDAIHALKAHGFIKGIGQLDIGRIVFAIKMEFTPRRTLVGRTHV
mmetsp:Transcript_34704/g.72217  ORF Transcript_34704/g.72217 Transcript_34704/m.72217 type:complete len:238 (-) Transcript_34704:94-807(-)